MQGTSWATVANILASVNRRLMAPAIVKAFRTEPTASVFEMDGSRPALLVLTVITCLVIGICQASLAADSAAPDDIIFDGSRLLTPIPSSGSFSKDSGADSAKTNTGELDNGNGHQGQAKYDDGAAKLDSGAENGDSSAKVGTASQTSNSDSEAVRKAERKIERDLAQSEQDLTMYQQMSQVINWLNQYCVWNHHWPEPIEETNQAVNQLCELVPNNPYKWKSKVQEAQGQSTDPDYLYLNQPMNQPTDASTGFEGDSMDPGTSFEALGNKRIKLVFNPSLTVAEVKSWETDPPQEWEDEPGTITGISNSQNLIVVWGAGADGKPLKVPGSRKTRIFVSNVWMSETGNENQ